MKELVHELLKFIDSARWHLQSLPKGWMMPRTSSCGSWSRPVVESAISRAGWRRARWRVCSGARSWDPYCWRSPFQTRSTPNILSSKCHVRNFSSFSMFSVLGCKGRPHSQPSLLSVDIHAALICSMQVFVAHLQVATGRDGRGCVGY